MTGFLVLLTDDPAKGKEELKTFAEKHKLKLPLTVFENANGPENYNISKDADLTVMYWLARTIKSNHTSADGKLSEKDQKAILDGASSILE